MTARIAYLDGPRLARSLFAAADWVAAGREEINRINVFPQDHFHHDLVPPVVGAAIRRRKSSQVSASPRTVSPLATKANMRMVSTV